MSVSLIVHDIRSCHNVGSLLRTAEGLGVQHVYLTGYTPYPILENDTRLPHIRNKIHAQIHKTALDAEDIVSWSHHEDIQEVLNLLRQDNYQIAALEQSANSTPLPQYKPTSNTALLLGREVEGIDEHLLSKADVVLEIPMIGKKESFNVVQAAAMALYQMICVAEN
jgi:23S rRNA (guanosine2251-2'-O)-methyltransferase